MRVNLLKAVLALFTAAALAFVTLPCVALVLRVPVASLRDALSQPEALEALTLTIKTSALAVAVCVLLGTPAAYLLARVEFRGRELVGSLLNLPMVLPPVVAGVALLMALGRRGMLGGVLEAFGVELPFTTAAVVIAQAFVGMPYHIQSARAGFEAVPRQLEDASRTLGASDGATFLRVTVPLSWPALACGAILCWGRAVGEFGATIMFAGNSPGVTRTMPLAILTAMQGDFDDAGALALILLVFSSVVFVAGHWLIPRLGRIR